MIRFCVCIFLVFGLTHKTQAQEVLIKGDSTSMINVYGDYRLSSINLNKTPKKQNKTFTAKGYKILLYSGLDKDEAYKTQTQFRKKFSKENIGIQFDSPKYFVKAGNFQERETADLFLEKIQRDFPNAVIVNDQITVNIH